jgi:hypothetical protein
VNVELPTTLVDAETVARYLEVDRDFVYVHAAELGARRLGTGPKARLRFSLSEVDERLRTCSVGRESDDAAKRKSKPIRRRRRSEPLGTGAPLLPIRGVRDA